MPSRTPHRRNQGFHRKRCYRSALQSTGPEGTITPPTTSASTDTRTLPYRVRRVAPPGGEHRLSRKHPFPRHDECEREQPGEDLQGADAPHQRGQGWGAGPVHLLQLAPDGGEARGAAGRPVEAHRRVQERQGARRVSGPRGPRSQGNIAVLRVLPLFTASPWTGCRKDYAARRAVA